MSEIVGDILTELRSISATSLGAAWHRLPFIFDLSKNNIRTGEKGFGSRALGATPTESTVKSYTVDQGFEVILGRSITRTASDLDRENVITNLFDEADKIFVATILSKINLAGNVLLVTGPELSEPEFFDDNKMVYLRLGVIVKYRNAIT